MVKKSPQQLDERFYPADLVTDAPASPASPSLGRDAGTIARLHVPVIKNPQLLQVDLSVAHTVDAPLELPINGSVIWCDYTAQDTDVARIQLRDGGGWFHFYRGSPAIHGVPFDRPKLINSAIAGGVLFVGYSVDYLEDPMRVL